ncbi:MAG: type II secretion system F family protein [Proteobacteria bacterium]|nr:type II secretion system F family protein [Pseudomonadota bacterium]MBS0464865.1 type II secretion system F family protein [Pseudomonadota bacterium]
MAQFRYQALSATGEAIRGQMDAGSAEEVIGKLQEAGHIPIEAKRADEIEAAGDWTSLFRAKALSAEQIGQFTEQLATLLAAGQPLDRALTILFDLPEAAAARKVIANVRDAVRGGSSLSSALEQQHGVFSRLYVSTVRAGEVGGSLHETLARLAEYLERSRGLRSRVVNALIYPAILVAMISISLLFLLGYVVPQFQQMYEGLGAQLPLLTKIVLGIGNTVRGYWWLLPIVGVLALAWLDRKRRDAAWRRAVDAFMLRRKLLGSLIARLETARLARTVGTLVKNGVPLLQALTIARNVLGNRVLAEAVDVAAEEVKTGSGLAHALAKREVFPRLAVQMVQVGEESGELDSMLLKAADTFDRETAQAMDRFLTALVPALTVLMSIVVGIVILSILTPLYDLTNSIG